MFKWLKNIGPGTLVAAAFIGPGTVTLCTIAGAQFGFSLLWAMLLSIIATIILQEMAARVGIFTQKDLATVIKEQISSPFLTNMAIFLILSAIVIGNTAYEAGNISGATLGLTAIFGDAYKSFYPIIIGSIVFVLLGFGNYKILEKSLIGLVILMSFSFLISAFITKPDWVALFNGLLIPSIPQNSILIIIGLVGTTIVPYNLFLHTSLVTEKWKNPDDLSLVRKDLILSISLGGIISLGIMVAAASISSEGVNNALDLAKGLKPLYGSMAKYFLGLGLFAAGITSAITAPLAAAYVARSCFGWKKNLKDIKFRLVWSIVLILGIVFSSLDYKPIKIITFAQVSNGILLPITAVFLLWLVNKTNVLGEFRNSKLQNTISIIIIFDNNNSWFERNFKCILMIELNCDVGEGMNNESSLMPYISTCSIACGGHAGDIESMTNAVSLALKNNVKIGAHPSYPDKENFGRKSMIISNETLKKTIVSQIKALEKIAQNSNSKLSHIKPHGALYNDIAKNQDRANSFLDAIESFKSTYKLFVPFGSIIAKEAKATRF